MSTSKNDDAPPPSDDNEEDADFAAFLAFCKAPPPPVLPKGEDGTAKGDGAAAADGDVGGNGGGGGGGGYNSAYARNSADANGRNAESAAAVTSPSGGDGDGGEENFAADDVAASEVEGHVAQRRDANGSGGIASKAQKVEAAKTVEAKTAQTATASPREGRRVTPQHNADGIITIAAKATSSEKAGTTRNEWAEAAKTEGTGRHGAPVVAEGRGNITQQRSAKGSGRMATKATSSDQMESAKAEENKVVKTEEKDRSNVPSVAEGRGHVAQQWSANGNGRIATKGTAYEKSEASKAETATTTKTDMAKTKDVRVVDRNEGASSDEESSSSEDDSSDDGTSSGEESASSANEVPTPPRRGASSSNPFGDLLVIWKQEKMASKSEVNLKGMPSLNRTTLEDPSLFWGRAKSDCVGAKTAICFSSMSEGKKLAAAAPAGGFAKPENGNISAAASMASTTGQPTLQTSDGSSNPFAGLLALRQNTEEGTHNELQRACSKVEKANTVVKSLEDRRRAELRTIVNDRSLAKDERKRRIDKAKEKYDQLAREARTGDA